MRRGNAHDIEFIVNDIASQIMPAEQVGGRIHHRDRRSGQAVGKGMVTRRTQAKSDIGVCDVGNFKRRVAQQLTKQNHVRMIGRSKEGVPMAIVENDSPTGDRDVRNHSCIGQQLRRAGLEVSGDMGRRVGDRALQEGIDVHAARCRSGVAGQIGQVTRQRGVASARCIQVGDRHARHRNSADGDRRTVHQRGDRAGTEGVGLRAGAGAGGPEVGNQVGTRVNDRHDQFALGERVKNVTARISAGAQRGEHGGIARDVVHGRMRDGQTAYGNRLRHLADRAVRALGHVGGNVRIAIGDHHPEAVLVGSAILKLSAAKLNIVTDTGKLSQGQCAVVANHNLRQMRATGEHLRQHGIRAVVHASGEELIGRQMEGGIGARKVRGAGDRDRRPATADREFREQVEQRRVVGPEVCPDIVAGKLHHQSGRVAVRLQVGDIRGLEAEIRNGRQRVKVSQRRDDGLMAANTGVARHHHGCGGVKDRLFLSGVDAGRERHDLGAGIGNGQRRAGIQRQARDVSCGHVRRKLDKRARAGGVRIAREGAAGQHHAGREGHPRRGSSRGREVARPGQRTAHDDLAAVMRKAVSGGVRNQRVGHLDRDRGVGDAVFIGQGGGGGARIENIVCGVNEIHIEDGRTVANPTRKGRQNFQLLHGRRHRAVAARDVCQDKAGAAGGVGGIEQLIECAGNLFRHGLLLVEAGSPTAKPRGQRRSAE